MIHATIGGMAQKLDEELAMLEAIFTPSGDRRFYIDVEEIGVLGGVAAARYFAEEFRDQHPALIVEQRNTRIWVTVPEVR